MSFGGATPPGCGWGSRAGHPKWGVRVFSLIAPPPPRRSLGEGLSNPRGCGVCFFRNGVLSGWKCVQIVRHAAKSLHLNIPEARSGLREDLYFSPGVRDQGKSLQREQIFFTPAFFSCLQNCLFYSFRAFTDESLRTGRCNQLSKVTLSGPRLSRFIPVEREIFNASIIPIPNPLHSFSVVLMDAQI